MMCGNFCVSVWMLPACCESVLSGVFLLLFLELKEPAKRRATMFLGFRSDFVRHDVSSCASGGGSRGGGGPRTPRYHGPPGVSPETAGRPMGPATLPCEVL